MNELSFRDISIIKSGGAIDYNTASSAMNPIKKDTVKINNVSTGTVTKVNTSKKSLRNTTTAKESSQSIHKTPFYPSSTQMSTKTTAWKKTIAESNMVPYENERTTLFSTWTPLNDEKTNTRLFDERKQLCLKWFETWNDTQRRMIMEDLLYTSKPKQLFQTREILNKISPVYHIDFTRILPRVVCLYIMSFLDPRSLSRCAQVCWYWKMLTESDQLWMPKCLRFGWNLNYIPSSFESGIWKQFYIENIKALQYIPITKANTPMPTERGELTLRDISNGKFGFSKFAKSAQKSQRTYKAAGNLKQPPWRANNSNPNHLYRYNYLDVNEELQNKKNNIEKKMRALTLENMKNSQAMAQTTEMESNDINPQQQIIENLLNKGNALINQLKAENEQKQNFERSFLLPNFAEEAATLKDLDAKKEAWKLLDA